jgi:hypothetical protein
MIALQLSVSGLRSCGRVGPAGLAGPAVPSLASYGGHFYSMGGCMGCHGSQGQNPLVPYGAGDFSVILARGTVSTPEIPATLGSQGLKAVPRNRSLSK